MINSQTEETGRREYWGERVFLLDALGGFLSLREQMIREIGQEFTADIFYRAGFSTAQRLMTFVERTLPEGDGRARLVAAFSLLTDAGYGRVLWDAEQGGRPGEIVVTVQNSLEGETIREQAGRAGMVCSQLRGVLRGIVQSLPPMDGMPTGVLECVEIQCIANESTECRFVVATQEQLSRHGYQVGDNVNNSVRETLLRLNRQLEDVLEAAQRDSLTGLYNRAHFESVLRDKIEYANRRTDTLAVAMIDLDGFKEVNDSQGHSMGDVALRQVAHLLASQARDTDIVARYGGDEFAWLMPGTSVEAALAVADRIRRQLEDLRVGMEMPISLSIGIAACPEDATTMADLINLADAAMYVAKEDGGDQVRRYIAPKEDGVSAESRPRKSRVRTEDAPAPAPPRAGKANTVPLDFPD